MIDMSWAAATALLADFLKPGCPLHGHRDNEKGPIARAAGEPVSRRHPGAVGRARSRRYLLTVAAQPHSTGRVSICSRRLDRLLTFVLYCPKHHE
jgi:hypothetical protein